MSLSRSIPTLLLLLSLGCATSQQSAPPALDCVRDPGWVALDMWDAVIEGYEAADEEKPPASDSIVFIGSSSIWFWDTLSEDMTPLPSLNRGFGGSVIVQSTHYADRIVLPYEPSAVVLYAGDNDIALGSTSDCAALDFDDFVKRIHADAPQTPIYFISIKPSPARWDLWDEMQRANASIEARTATDATLEYIDISEAMLDAEGQPIEELFVEDGLHMNAAGYEIWASIIQPRLLEDLGP